MPRHQVPRHGTLLQKGSLCQHSSSRGPHSLQRVARREIRRQVYRRRLSRLHGCCAFHPPAQRRQQGTGAIIESTCARRVSARVYCILARSDASSPYTRDTYRYTPLLALLLTPNIFLHPSFGKYVFAACDIFNGLIIYNVLLKHIIKPDSKETTSSARMKQATLYTAVHLLNPMVFSISTRGSSESVLSTFVLLTLHALLNDRWTVAAILLGLSTHWKIYPIIYGVSCVCLIGSLTSQHKHSGLAGWLKTVVNLRTVSFALVSAGTFLLLGGFCYAMCVISSFMAPYQCLNPLIAGDTPSFTSPTSITSTDSITGIISLHTSIQLISATLL